MRKSDITRRILCFALTLVVGMSMTCIGVYAAGEGDNASTDNFGVSAVEGMTDDSTDPTDPTEPTQPVQPEKKELSVKATAGNTSAVVKWTAPEGAPEGTEYTVTFNGQISPLTTTETEVKIEGLTNGQEYTFTVSCKIKIDEMTYDEYEGVSKPITPSEALPKVTGLKAYRDYNGVTLKWNIIADSNVTDYKVYRDGKCVKTFPNKPSATTMEKYIGKSGYSKAHLDELTHTYYVKAYCSTDERHGPASTKIKKSCVRPLYVYVTLKETATLTSHSGGSVSHTFKRGTRLTTTGFGSGKYKFFYDGREYYVNRTRTKNASCDYEKDWDYTMKEAENFVNHAGYGSKKNYMLWASGYTQRVYAFKGSKGKWKCVKSWNICTGKASAPSPTGNKEIWKRISNRHNLPYWSCYSTYNAFHGAFSSWVKKLGTPQTSGCFRNKNSDAKWVYYNVPIGSKVLSY